MIKRLQRLNDYHKAELLEQAQNYLAGWEEEGHPEIIKEYGQWVCKCNNEDESELVLYRCSCGQYIADWEDYSGRDEDADRCHNCNAHYDYSEKELSEL
jgi:hypothetical protein